MSVSQSVLSAVFSDESPLFRFPCEPDPGDSVTVRIRVAKDSASRVILLSDSLTFGSLMAFGLGFLVILQAMINMGVSIGLLPVTGQPLPMVSMGGTSLMATGLILGMILSVTRSMEDEEMNKEQEIQALTETTEDEREPESRD